MKGSQEKLVDWKKILAIIKKNWMVLKKDSLRLRMLLMFPLIMIVIFGYTAGKVPTNVSGAVVDYDHSQLSAEVLSQIYANNLYSIKRVYSSQDEGRHAIESGEIKILFVIPQHFESDIYSGKTATISVIVDESDPTIAQMTRASTAAFVQGISDQIKAQRLAMISLQARQVQSYLNSMALPQTDGSANLKSIQSTFLDASRTYAGTNTVLAGTVQDMQNAIGHVYDPNEAIATIKNNSADSKTSTFLFASSVSKQQAADQIIFYQGLQGSNAKLYADTSLIYAGSNAIYADYMVDQQALSMSGRAMSSASDTLEEIAANASMASSDPIVISMVEPYGSGRKGLDFLIPSIIALIVFQGAVMGMGRAIAGERRDGSLTRVFLTPTSNVTIISGTLLFYIIFETIRSSFIVFIAMLIFGVTIKGSIFSIVFIIAIYAAGATGVGMILSVLSKSQEQYMALAMLVTLPTIFLAGVFIPVETMPNAIQGATHVLPITYASDALRGIMIKGFELNLVVPDVIFLSAFAVLMLGLSVLLFKRELL